MRLQLSVFVLAFFVTGCATTVSPIPESDSVRIISTEQVEGVGGEKCERLGDATARVGPSPKTEAQGTPSEVEARNRAYQMGATHVAVGTEERFECNAFGRRAEGSHGTGYSCYKLPATAYRC